MSAAGFLFDLDGTLADTAPDLVAALNDLLDEDGRAPIPFAIARNVVSHGALGLIRLGFGLPADDPVDSELRQRFLDRYQAGDHKYSHLFIDLKDIFNLISKTSGCWGIVTNKPRAYTEPLLARLGILDHSQVVVSGDTLPQRKPDPAPLLFASERLGLDPATCIYIGDAERDIVAGRNAGMRTLASCYGYIRPGENPEAWGADGSVLHRHDVCPMLCRMAEEAA